jgi:homoserine dehydrogenase
MRSARSGSGFTIALLGGGTVGAAVARGLVSRYEEWGIEIAGIAVRDLAKAEAAGLGKIAPLTTDPLALATSDVDLVVELMGGLDPALPVVETALKAGRPVVTANKLLLANFGARLEGLARASGAALRFESAVAAGVPVIGVLARDMAANEITSIKGIINGTTNYILTKMESEGWSYEQALGEAQKIGYAEADPRSDVEGEDAAAKLVILARMAAGAWPALSHVQLDDAPGITGVQASDIAAAASRGARLRMLASWENGGDDASKDVLSVRVTEVPADSRLGTTVGGGNMIVVSGDLIGDLTLAGAGAGPGSTASGVISDILAIAGGEGSSWGELPPADNAPAPAWFLAAKKKRGA